MEPNTEQMSEVLDLIHDIALKLQIVDGIPSEVERGLEKIHALARYKYMVLSPDEVAEYRDQDSLT